MGLGDGLLHVIEAPFEILKGVFDTIIGLISTMLSAFASLIGQLGDLFSGTLGFVAGKAIIMLWLWDLVNFRQATSPHLCSWVPRSLAT